MEKKDYSFWIGVYKNLKSHSVILIPPVILLLLSVPGKYAIIAGPVAYQLKNYWEIKSGRKLGSYLGDLIK